MRILPVALIVIGLLGIAKHLGLIPIGMIPFIAPLLLIAVGVALLFRRRHGCHGAWQAHCGDRTAAPPPAGRV